MKKVYLIYLINNFGCSCIRSLPFDKTIYSTKEEAEKALQTIKEKRPEEVLIADYAYLDIDGTILY